MWKCEIHGRIAFCISVPYVKYIPAQSQSPFGLDISYFKTQNICFDKACTRHTGNRSLFLPNLKLPTNSVAPSFWI